jgi:hypothetical protein
VFVRIKDLPAVPFTILDDVPARNVSDDSGLIVHGFRADAISQCVEANQGSNTMATLMLCVAISSTFMDDILQESLPTADRHGVRRVHLICTRQRRIVGVPRYVRPHIPQSLGTDGFADRDGR